MRAGRRTQTYNFNRTMPFSPNSVASWPSSVGGRNLEKYQLGGVIFGCKTSTMKECQSKQLFGLPANHFSYVKNIDPGLPIFLFNYSDRKLHGIFEASSKGQMYIDPYAWIDDDSELDRTQYPAQVRFRVRLQCQPLSEDKFANVIADNYYTNNHFCFELDHRQAGKLISLLASLAFAAGSNLKWRCVSPSPPSTPNKGEACQTIESETQHLTSSSRRTDSTEITSLEGDIKPLDTVEVVREVDENEMNLIYVKLKELALGHERQDIFISDNGRDASNENDNCTVKKEKDYLEVPAGLEQKEESLSPVQHQSSIDQLKQEVEELTVFKKIQTQTNCYLEHMLRQTELKIHRLIDRCTKLESAFNLPLTHVENTTIQPYTEQQVNPKESLSLKVNLDAKLWLPTLDLYYHFPTKSLYPMNFFNPYDSVILPKVGWYSPILYKWALCPSLNQNKGSLAGISLTNKIFRASKIDCFSHIEVLDLDTVKWIAAQHIQCKKRFYLGSFDESKMVPSINSI